MEKLVILNLVTKISCIFRHLTHTPQVSSHRILKVADLLVQEAYFYFKN